MVNSGRPGAHHVGSIPTLISNYKINNMKSETFLIVGLSTVLTIAFFLGGRKQSCAKRLFGNIEKVSKEYRFISLEIAETQADSLTTNY